MNNTELVDHINNTLKRTIYSTINIINDKFTLSVFKSLEENLKQIQEVNFIVREAYTVDQTSQEYIEKEVKDIIFGEHDVKEKNKLEHFQNAKLMYDFVKEKVNVKIVNPDVIVKGNMLTINDEFMIVGSSSLEFTKMNNNHFNFNSILDYTMDKNQIINTNSNFNMLWYGDKTVKEYKEELISGLESVYKKY